MSVPTSSHTRPSPTQSHIIVHQQPTFALILHQHVTITTTYPQLVPPLYPPIFNCGLADTNPHFDWQSLSRQTWFRNSSFFRDSILQSLQNKILISALWLCLSLKRARCLSLSLWSQEARSRCKRENERQDISQCPLVQDKPDTFTQNRTVGRPPAVIVTVNIFLTRIFVSKSIIMQKFFKCTSFRILSPTSIIIDPLLNAAERKSSSKASLLCQGWFTGGIIVGVVRRLGSGGLELLSGCGSLSLRPS